MLQKSLSFSFDKKKKITKSFKICFLKIFLKIKSYCLMQVDRSIYVVLSYFSTLEKLHLNFS